MLTKVTFEAALAVRYRPCILHLGGTLVEYHVSYSSQQTHPV